MARHLCGRAPRISRSIPLTGEHIDLNLAREQAEGDGEETVIVTKRWLKTVVQELEVARAPSAAERHDAIVAAIGEAIAA